MSCKIDIENINNWTFKYIFLNKLKDKEHNTLHTHFIFLLCNLESYTVLFFLKHNIETFKRYLRVWSSEYDKNVFVCIKRK